MKEGFVKTEAEIGVVLPGEGAPRIAFDHGKLEEARTDSALESSEGAWTC